MPISKTAQRVKHRALLKQQYDYRDQNPDPDKWLTRRQVCDRLGISGRQMRHLETVGTLNSDRRNSAGYGLYAMEDVIRVDSRRRSGELVIRPDRPIEPKKHASFNSEQAQSIFKMLNAGVSLTSIVIETGLHPDAVQAIQEKYQGFEGAVLVRGDLLKKMNALRLPGRFPLTCGGDIYDLLQGLEEEQLCITCCEESSARECARCIVRKAAARAARPSPTVKAPPEAPPPEESGAKVSVGEIETQPQVRTGT